MQGRATYDQGYSQNHAPDQIHHDSQVQRIGQQQHYAQQAQQVGPSPLDVAQWLVYVEGGQVVGPVSANQVARAMRTGQVPSHASIQAVGEVFWTGLLEEPAVVLALKAL